MASQITPQLVQAVRDAVDIVDIAGEMTRLEKKGNSYKGLCPFHKEKSPSFSVDPVQGLYYCFGCSAGGDSIKLFQEHTGDDFPAAIEALARRYAIPLPETTRQGRPQRDLGAALAAAATFFQRQLERSTLAGGYLERRRIPRELRESYGLGYAPEGWDNLLQALRGQVPLEDLLAAGLAGRSERSGNPYDRFRNRLMFPIHTPSGRLVGFGGRTLGDDKAKYVNTSETEHFHKGNLLYGFHLAKRTLREHGKALLVEGYFDVLGAVASGIPWTVAGMGTSLTAEQARLLSRYTDDVVIGYDGDEAGQKAAQRCLPILLSVGLGVRRARFPAGHDPDSLRLEEGPETVSRIVGAAADAVALEIERLIPATLDPDPRARSREAAAVGEILRPIRDPVARHNYSKSAAERLGVPLEMLFRRLGRTATTPRALSEPTPRVRELVPKGMPPGRTTEEKAVALLMRGGVAVPAAGELLPVEVFLDPACRNIYAAFCALYRGGDRHPPTAAEVVAKLSNEGGAIDRAAGLLLQDSDSDDGDLAETLDELLHRWRKQRQSELMRQIRQAQQQGDHPRLAELLEEKKNLNRSLHPSMTGTWNPSARP